MTNVVLAGAAGVLATALLRQSSETILTAIYKALRLSLVSFFLFFFVFFVFASVSHHDYFMNCVCLFVCAGVQGQ